MSKDKDKIPVIEKKIVELADQYEMKKIHKSAKEILTENTVDDEMDSKTVKQSAFEEGIKQLFTKDNLQMKTELSPPQITAMSRGRIFEGIYKIGVMNELIDNIQILSVSKGRKGRTELVALVRNSQDIEEIDSGMSGIAKLMGNRN